MRALRVFGGECPSAAPLKRRREVSDLESARGEAGGREKPLPRGRRCNTFLVLLLMLFASRTFAQDASFEASVDKNPVAVDDQFTLSFELKNAGMSGGKNLKLPSLERFHVLAGPSTSSNMQWINGQVSSSVTYSYVLRAKDVGKFTIGAASIEAGGATLSSNPISIEVVKGSPRPKPQAQGGQPGISADVSQQLADNIFLRATVDKSRVMQGEQVNLVYRLYTRVQVQNYNLTKAPTMTGFWSEDVELPKQIQLTSEVVNGKQFQVGVIKRSALFPTQSGTLEISPMEIQMLVTVRRRSLDPFDAFFGDPFGQQIEYTVKSDPIRIKVDPLPPGAPSSFKGAVGKFSIVSKVDQQQTKTNEPLTYKVTISGTGNIKVLESPTIEVPTDFEQYTPKVSENINRRDAKISGTKTFEYILIPRYPGKKSIKPVEFSYFDLGKKEYVTLRSPEIEVKVEQGAVGAAPFVSSNPREEVQLLSQDVRFIKVARPSFTKQGEYLHTSGAFIAMLLLPLAGVAGAFVYSRQRVAVMSDMAGYRNRQALKVAKRGLKNAAAMLARTEKGIDTSSESRVAFYSEVARAIWKYLGDKLSIQQADISIDGVVNELSRRSISPETSSSLKSLLESCEMARFAPTSLSTETMKQTYADASNIIVEIERTLRA